MSIDVAGCGTLYTTPPIDILCKFRCVLAPVGLATTDVPVPPPPPPVPGIL